MLKHYTKIALFIYLILSVFALHFYSGDEYFQLIGFAKYRLGLMPEMYHTIWELKEQVRSTLQPSVLFCIYKFLALLFNYHGFFFVNLIIKLISAAFIVFCLYLFIQCFLPLIKESSHQKWFILLTYFSYLTVFLGVHFSADSTGQNFFILGFVIAYQNKDSKLPLKDILAGIFLGISFIIRCQDGFLIAGLMMWLLFYNKTSIKSLFRTNIALVLTYLILGVLVDRWFYNNWTIAIFNYYLYFHNLKLLGTVAGPSPWYFYITRSFILLPFGPLYLLAILIFTYFKPKNVITWIIWPYIIVHILIGYKEIRYMSPINLMMPFIMFFALEELMVRFNFKIKIIYVKIAKLAWYLNCCLIILVILPSPGIIQAAQIAIKYKKPTIVYITNNKKVFPPELDIYSRSNLLHIYTNNLNYCPPNYNCLVLYYCTDLTKDVSAYKIVSKNCVSYNNTILNKFLTSGLRTNIYEIKNIEN